MRLSRFYNVLVHTNKQTNSWPKYIIIIITMFLLTAIHLTLTEACGNKSVLQVNTFQSVAFFAASDRWSDLGCLTLAAGRLEPSATMPSLFRLSGTNSGWLAGVL